MTKSAQQVTGQPGVRLRYARADARERYLAIAAAMKAEAGVVRHVPLDQLGGLAFSNRQTILAPKGVTRRQLYVLAHECGHIVLHNTIPGQMRPGHVKEYEAEVYAHRAFARYGLEVPPNSTQWARRYVGLWIAKDRIAGYAICPRAEAWADGLSNAFDTLPTVDGMPKDDFSKSLDRFTAKGVRLVQQQESVAVARPEVVPTAELLPPNACGTCLYFERSYRECRAHAMSANLARALPKECDNGRSWRPHPQEIRRLTQAVHQNSFWKLLGEAIVKRIGRS